MRKGPAQACGLHDLPAHGRNRRAIGPISQGDVDMSLWRGRARHTMYLQAEGHEIRGLHRGRITQGTVKGHVRPLGRMPQ